MAAEETTNQGSNVKLQFNAAQLGLNMDNTVSQVKKGMLTYALNANLESFDASSVNYQNEQGNEPCGGNTFFPANYALIGHHFIAERNKHVYFLVNTSTGVSEIGYMLNNDCVYHTYITGSCLNFDINFPIQKVVHKITNCTTEIYWTDAKNPRRFLDLDEFVDGKDFGTDCNLLNIQPNFDIPNLTPSEVLNGGELTAGTYQFAIQYCNAQGAGYTSYYSITNPLPIANTNIETLDFNYPVNKSIRLNITNIDTTGYFEYYNLAVIKTVNNITSAELIGTYFIDKDNNQITYSGQNQAQIKIVIEEIFEKFPYYDVADDVTVAQDQLIWTGLTTNARKNYQSIASQITLKWETYKIPASENYSKEVNALNLRGYLRDEVYAFEIVFLLKNGKQTDGFHIPGRAPVSGDLTPVYKTGTSANADFIGTPTGTDVNGQYSPKWKIYNTGSVTGSATGDSIGSATPYQYGDFSYWESDVNYPSGPDGVAIWGSLAGTPIRHHKFPDNLISPAFESAVPTIVLGKYSVQMQSSAAVYPIGVRVDTAQIEALIQTLPTEQKNMIAGYKIVRGNRNTNKSIVGKGILRNIGKYTREGTEYYFPNYPYNDLKQDPFLLEANNAYYAECQTFKIVTTAPTVLQYTSCETGQVAFSDIIPTGTTKQFCSVSTPVVSTGAATITSSTLVQYAITVLWDNNGNPQNATKFECTDINGVTFEPVVTNYPYDFGKIISSTTYPRYLGGSTQFTIVPGKKIFGKVCYPDNLNAFATDESKFRMVFNSPETSFGQPTLGNVLKLENILYGAGKSHFVKVKNNAMYKLLSQTAQISALASSYAIAKQTGTFDAAAMFTTYQSYLTIYINGITRKNFAYSFNSISSYDYSANINNGLGIKQRELDKYQYLLPGVQSVGDLHDLNNFQRESSIYVKTAGSTPLPFVKDSTSISGLIEDDSRFTLSQKGKCGNPEELQSIKVLSYYASLKNINTGQWGQIYTYETIDTGFQIDRDSPTGIKTVFGGDTFISRFAFKTKLPFFIDNRVGAADDSDINYDDLGNIAYPQYWHSARSIVSNYSAGSTTLQNIVSIKAHNLDCPNDNTVTQSGTTTTTTTSGSTTTTTTAAPNSNPGFTDLSNSQMSYDGKIYMFAYGIPYFYCESSINLDLRQAYNSGEGNFYPRASSGIPDEWLQQTRVPIAFDNTYYYNVSYSKQNTENYFSHLPLGWKEDSTCDQVFPFRAIYSEPQSSSATNKVNNWLLYRPISFFDFPQSYGALTSLDGIQNRAILARFENKSLLYNTMLTIDTSNPQAAYMGNSTLFKSAPPIDFAETDLGYVGSQHKFLLKVPQGQITADAKRGQIFLISGNQAVDLTGFGSGVNRFMTDHLAFEILRYYPNADVDNHFNGIGLHGVYDSKFDRVIITKLDYIPQPDYVGVIKYGSSPSVTSTYKKYYIESEFGIVIVDLNNPLYFCNKSWTMSFNVNTQTWVSFHTYLPNYYVGENNFFYSGINRTIYDSQSAISGGSSCALTFVAAVPTTESCKIPSGNAITYNAPTTTTTTSSTSTSTTSTTSSTSTTSTTSSTSTTSTSTTTSTTTVAPTTTTTTTLPVGPTTTTTTTPYIGPSTTSTTSSTSTSTTTSTSSTSTTTSTTTIGCTPLVYGVDWSISGNQNPVSGSTENYIFTALTTNPNNYPITGQALTQGGTQYPPVTFTLASPGSTHVVTVYWDNVCDGNQHYISGAALNSCTPNIPENYHQYTISCGGGGTTTTTTSTSSTTTTTTTALATVILDPRNSLSGSSYTPYINGVADPSWDNGSRSYPLGTTIRLDYSSPACSVTLNGSPYTTGTTITLSTTGARTFTLLNADHWVNDGGTICAGNELRQPIINDCGTTSYNVINSCSCSCNVACNGTYFGANYCDGNALKRAEYYYCNNAPTGYVETISSCSCTCNQACSGTYWTETCSGTTLNRVEKYVCNNANTGNTQTIACSATCGASTAANWVDNGSTFCGSGSCHLYQPQIDNNPCSATYNQTRNVDLGVSSTCGTNYWEYYCVNYGVAPYEYRRRQVNTCTGNTGVDELVSYDATECGYYSPLPSFGISASAGSSGVACTRTIGNTAYCSGGDPYIGNTIHTTDNPSSSVFGAGFYHINISGDEYIQINGSGVVVDRGSC